MCFVAFICEQKCDVIEYTTQQLLYFDLLLTSAVKEISMRGNIGTEWKFTAMLWATFRLCAHDCCRGSVIVSSWNSLSDLVSFLHSDPFVPLGTKAALYVRGRKQEGFLVLCPNQTCMRIINHPLSPLIPRRGMVGGHQVRGGVTPWTSRQLHHTHSHI